MGAAQAAAASQARARWAVAGRAARWRECRINCCRPSAIRQSEKLEAKGKRSGRKLERRQRADTAVRKVDNREQYISASPLRVHIGIILCLQ